MPEPTAFPVAALDHEIGAPRTLRPREALGVAIIRRVAINDNGGRSTLLGSVDFHRPMAPRITGHHDLAFNIHASGGQLIVIRRQAVVDVHYRRSDGACSRI